MFCKFPKFLFHVWDNWVVTRKGNLVTVVGEDVVGAFVTQERKCLRCGLIKIKTTETQI